MTKYYIISYLRRSGDVSDFIGYEMIIGFFERKPSPNGLEEYLSTIPVESESEKYWKLFAHAAVEIAKEYEYEVTIRWKTDNDTRMHLLFYKPGMKATKKFEERYKRKVKEYINDLRSDEGEYAYE